MARKTASLFGKHLQTALRAEQVWLKAEELPSYLPFYVNQGNLDALLNNANQLIVGRRGSGKTHLLGAFQEYITQERKEEACVSISILEAYPKTPPTVGMESDEFASTKVAHEIFDGFLRVFFKRFLDFITTRLKDLQKSYPTEMYPALFQDANDRLTQLLEAIEVGRDYPIKKRSKDKLNHVEEVGKGAHAELGMALSNAKPSVKTNLGISRNRGGKKTKSTTSEIENLISVDLFQVRELILDVLDIVHINVLYILIDEWMELDKNTPSRLQAAFGQLLKATFFNTAKISVKIASVWHETTLYDRDDMERSKGIQLNHDITIAADLDSAFLTNHDEIYDFCTQLLFKRLSNACKPLKELEDKDGKISDVFIQEIFDDLDNYKAFIAASHGIPRDIMNIFQVCAHRIKRDFTNRAIDYPLIIEVARNRYMLQKRKQIDPASPAQSLLKLINGYMDRTGHRLFLVENADAGSRALRKLVDEELIHPIPTAVTHRAVADAYKAYHIDYGNFADWATTKRMDVTALLNEVVLPHFPIPFEEVAQTYIINISEVADKKGDCQDCHRVFELTNPVFKKAKICPYCASENIVER